MHQNPKQFPPVHGPELYVQASAARRRGKENRIRTCPGQVGPSFGTEIRAVRQCCRKRMEYCTPLCQADPYEKRWADASPVARKAACATRDQRSANRAKLTMLL